MHASQAFAHEETEIMYNPNKIIAQVHIEALSGDVAVPAPPLRLHAREP